MQRQPRRAAQSGPNLPPTASHSSFLCRHPWPLARTRATNYGLSAARPSTLRVCARPVRATCRPRAQEVSRTASCRLRVVFAYAPTAARLRGLPPAACSAHTAPPSGLMKGCRGRASVMRHARATAHTLRVAVRSAAVTRSFAHVRSIGQRGRQRLRCSGHPAATARNRQPSPSCSTRQQAPGRAHQKPPQSRNRPALNPTSLGSTSKRKRASDSLT